MWHWLVGDVNGVLNCPKGFHSHCGLPNPNGMSQKGIKLEACPRQFWQNSHPLDLASKPNKSMLCNVVPELRSNSIKNKSKGTIWGNEVKATAKIQRRSQSTFITREGIMSDEEKGKNKFWTIEDNTNWAYNQINMTTIYLFLIICITYIFLIYTNWIHYWNTKEYPSTMLEIQGISLTLQVGQKFKSIDDIVWNIQ